MRDLNELRAEIDRLDREIVPLLCARMSASAEVAEYKRVNNLPVLDKAREDALLEKIGAAAGGKYAAYVLAIYETILAESRKYQSEILESK